MGAVDGQSKMGDGMNSHPSDSQSSDVKGVAKRNRVWQRFKRVGLRLFIGLLAVGLALYLLLCGILVSNETDLIFPAASEDYGRNVEYEQSSDLETVSYWTKDGVRLESRLLVREGCQHYIVFFHGNGERAAWLDAWAKRLSESLNATVLIAEYRGYAQRDHVVPDEDGLIQDGLAASECLQQRFALQANEITYYGRSIGGGVAVAVASRLSARHLILERTFDRLVDVAGERFWFMPVSLLMQNQFDSITAAEKYHGPVTQLHGDQDRLIPILHGRNLFQAFSGPKEWIEVESMGHNDPLPASTLAKVAVAVSEPTKAASTVTE